MRCKTGVRAPQSSYCSRIVSLSELFPKNFEAAFLQSNVFVAPDQRFFTLYNQKAQGKKLEIEFKDGGTAAAYPYTLRIYLRLENDKD